jgi:hypothetical protein
MDYKKLTQKTETTSVNSTDLINVVQDVSTLPVSKKITIANLLISLKSLFSLVEDGWILANENWIYASTTTFRVTGNVVVKYPIGTKIKLDNPTTKYFYVVGATYSAPNTTVTVTGGSDYILANSAISANYYSYQSEPQGHPQWFTYDPAPTASGSMTLADIVVSWSKFCIMGRKVDISLRFTCTTGGTASSTINTVLPVTATTNQLALSSYVADPASVGSLTFMGTAARTDTRRYDSGNFGLGASRIIAISGGYGI